MQDHISVKYEALEQLFCQKQIMKAKENEKKKVKPPSEVNMSGSSRESLSWREEATSRYSIKCYRWLTKPFVSKCNKALWELEKARLGSVYVDLFPLRGDQFCFNG